MERQTTDSQDRWTPRLELIKLQTDGLVERFNKILRSLIRKLVNKEGRDWDRLRPYVLFAYREVPQDATGFSPFELLYGKEVRGPLDLLKEVWEDDKKSDESVVSHILSVRERMEEMRASRRECQSCTEATKKRCDPTAREREMRRYFCCYLLAVIRY